MFIGKLHCCKLLLPTVSANSIFCDFVSIGISLFFGFKSNKNFLYDLTTSLQLSHDVISDHFEPLLIFISVLVGFAWASVTGTTYWRFSMSEIMGEIDKTSYDMSCVLCPRFKLYLKSSNVQNFVKISYTILYISSKIRSIAKIKLYCNSTTNVRQSYVTNGLTWMKHPHNQKHGGGFPCHGDALVTLVQKVIKKTPFIFCNCFKFKI